MAVFVNFVYVGFLLECKVDINAQDKGGSTPLIIALRLKQNDVIDLLIAQGADLTIRNKSGELPLDIALRLGLAAVTVLEAKGAPKSPGASSSDFITYINNLQHF